MKKIIGVTLLLWPFVALVAAGLIQAHQRGELLVLLGFIIGTVAIVGSVATGVYLLTKD